MNEKNKSVSFSNPALRISLYYLIFGFLWILLSDLLLKWIAGDRDLIQQYQTYKGWFFILVTGIIFYFIASLQFTRMTKLNRKLSANHRKLENLIDGYPSGLLLLDRKNMTITYINEYSVNLAIDWELFIETFFAAEDRTGKSSRLIDPDIPEQARDIKFRNREGRDMHIKLNSTPLKDDKGRNVEVLITFDDVTHQMKIEEELRRNEELQRILIQNIPNTTILLFDKELNILKSGGKEFLDQEQDPSDESSLFHLLSPYMQSALKGFESAEEIEYKDHFYSLRTAPVRNNHNEIIAGITILQDISLLVKSEKQVKERNLFVETLQDNLPVGVLVHSIRSGNLLYTNRKFREFSGWQKEEIDHYRGFLRKIFPDPDYRQVIWKKITDLLASGNRKSLSWDNISVDDGRNHLKKVSVVVIPIKEQDIIISSFIDTTEKNRAEQLLVETSRKYAGLFENSPLPLWEEDFSQVKRKFDEFRQKGVKNLKNFLQKNPGELQNLIGLIKINDRNKAARELDNIHKGAQLAKHPFLTISEASQLSFLEEFDALYRGKTVVDFNEKIKLNGNYMAVILRLSVMPGYEESLSHVLLALTDITKLQKIQDELREEKTRAEIAIEASKLGFWVANYKTGENLVNNRWAEILGYKKDEVEQTTNFFYDHLLEEDRKFVEDQVVWTRAEPGKVIELNYKMRHKEGHYVWIQSVAKPLEINEEGFVVRALGTHRDITMEREKEKELFKSLLTGEDMARQRIAAELHDSLGQYLSAANLNLQSIKEDMDLLNNDKYEYYQNATGFLKEAIEEVRNISANLMPPTIADFGLTPAIRSLINRLEKSSPAKIIFKENVEEIKFDPETELNLFRILQEGLSNAIRHSEASEISVQLLKNNRILTLSIEDNGRGFEVAAHLNVNDSLGISNIRNRVKALDGELNIESMPGKGTNIIVEINLE